MPSRPSVAAASPRRFLLPAAGALLLSVLAFAVRPAVPAGLGAWKGWGMILVSRGPPVKEALRTLEAAGVSPVWSEETQTVHLSDFVSSKRVTLEEARDRVLPGDPRHTAWLDALSGFYRIGDERQDWSILYVPRSSGSRALRALSRSLEPSDWIAPGEGGGGGPGFGWIVGLLLVAFCLRDARSGRTSVLAAGLPFASLWFSGSPAASVAGIWGYLILLTLLEDTEPESGEGSHIGFPRSIRRILPPALTVLLWGVYSPAALPGLGISAVSAGCLYLAVRDFGRWTAARRVHVVFRGVPLDPDRLERERDEAGRRRVLAGLAAAAIILAGVLPTGRSGRSDGEIALPPLPGPGTRIAGGALNPETVERLVRDRSGTELPSLADAVAHRAYQEALPYARIGQRTYGSLEPAVLERFTAEGTSVNRVRETVLEFDDPWVRSALREEEESGIGAVLADQRGIVRPVFGAAVRSGRPERLALRDVFFYIILLAPAALGAAWPGLVRTFGSVRSARAASRR